MEEVRVHRSFPFPYSKNEQTSPRARSHVNDFLQIYIRNLQVSMATTKGLFGLYAYKSK